MGKNTNAMEIEHVPTKNKYEKVQFISWEVHTGPYIHGQGVGLYTGLRSETNDLRTDALGQCKDIDARVAFTDEALKLAFAGSDPSPKTLKVFMAPEFLYRGAGGAYLFDLLDGWKSAPADLGLPPPYNGPWPGLFVKLRNLIAKKDYEHWIVVFGTAVGASFDTVDSNGIRQLDLAKASVVYNCALVQRGGATKEEREDTHIARKHFKSPIDFFNWIGAALQHGGNVEHFDPRTKRVTDTNDMSEGSALFNFGSVGDRDGRRLEFGIEICLDHCASAVSNNFGRIRAAGEYVNIQLVPSAGMNLWPESVRLLPANKATPTSYAFNCDGLSQQINTAGSHTQIWSRVDSGAAAQFHELVNANGGSLRPGRLLPMLHRVPTIHGLVTADLLWNNQAGVQGAGCVRVMDALPI